MADIQSNNATIRQALLLYQQHLLFQHHMLETYMPKNGKLNATPQDLAREEAYRREMQNVTALLSSDQIFPDRTGNRETLSDLNKSPEPDTEPYLNPLTGLWVFPETLYSPGPSGSTSISDGWGLVDGTKSVTSLGPASPAKDHRSESLESVERVESAPDEVRTRQQLKGSISSVKRKPIQASSPLQLVLNKASDTVPPPTGPPPSPPVPHQLQNTLIARQTASDVDPRSMSDVWSPILQHIHPPIAQEAGPAQPYHNLTLKPSPQPSPPTRLAGRSDEVHVKQSHLSSFTVDKEQLRHDASIPPVIANDQKSREPTFPSATGTHGMSGRQGVSPPVSHTPTEYGNICNDNGPGGMHQEPTSSGLEPVSHNDQYQQTFDTPSTTPPEPRYREKVFFNSTSLRLSAFGQPSNLSPSSMPQQPFARRATSLSAAHSANASVSSLHLDNRHQSVKPLDCHAPEYSSIPPNHLGGLTGVHHNSWKNSDVKQGDVTYASAPPTNLPPSEETVLHEMQILPESPSQHRLQFASPVLRPFGAATMNMAGPSPSMEPNRRSVDHSGLPTWSFPPTTASLGVANTKNRPAQTQTSVNSFAPQNEPKPNSLRPSGIAHLSSTAIGKAPQYPRSANTAAPISSEGQFTPNTLRAVNSTPRDTSQIPSFAPTLPEPRQQDLGTSHQPAIASRLTLAKPVAVELPVNHRSSLHTDRQPTSHLSHNEMANLLRLQDEFNRQDDMALAKQEAFARHLQAALDATDDSNRVRQFQQGSRAMPGSWQHHVAARVPSPSRESSQWQSLGSESDGDDVLIAPPSPVGVKSRPQANLIIKPPTVARAPFVNVRKPQSPVHPKLVGSTKHDATTAQSAADEIAKYEATQRAKEDAAAQAARATFIASQNSARASSTSKKVECTSCTDKDSASAMAILPCNHAYCGICIADAFRHKFAAGKIFICCNKTPCPVELASRFLPADFVTLYKSKMEERMATNLIYCAKPGCSAFIPESNLKGPLATCGKCRFITCSLCKNPEHKGICPPDSMGLKLMDLAGNKNWVQCSRCKAVVERDDGCLHMTCTCGYEFCYSCGGKWNECGSSCSRKA